MKPSTNDGTPVRRGVYAWASRDTADLKPHPTDTSLTGQDEQSLPTLPVTLLRHDDVRPKKNKIAGQALYLPSSSTNLKILRAGLTCCEESEQNPYILHNLADGESIAKG